MCRCFFYLFLLSLSTNLLAQTWFQISEKEIELECPDVLTFDHDRYEISNVCYGQERQNYQLETGKYQQDDRKIRFYQRQQVSRSFLQSLSEDLTLTYTKKQTGEIILEYHQQKFIFIVLE